MNPRRGHSGLGHLSPLSFKKSQEALFDVANDVIMYIIWATTKTV